MKKPKKETENIDSPDDIHIEESEIIDKPAKPDPLAEAKKAAAEMSDKYLRCLAEFDNYRKRSERERSAMYFEGAKAVLLTVLPVLDNFERAMKAEGQAADEPFRKGIDMIYKQLLLAIEGLGVTEIGTASGFDANLHYAVMHVEDENMGENEIAEVLQKGYMYKDKVIRHSMVKVAN